MSFARCCGRDDEGKFTIDDVVDGIAKKMIFRHPHVFGEQKANNAEQQGKKVTYVPNDGSGNMPELTVIAPKETEE